MKNNSKQFKTILFCLLITILSIGIYSCKKENNDMEDRLETSLEKKEKNVDPELIKQGYSVVKKYSNDKWMCYKKKNGGFLFVNINKSNSYAFKNNTNIILSTNTKTYKMLKNESILAGVMQQEAPTIFDDSGNIHDDLLFNLRGLGDDVDSFSVGIYFITAGPQDENNLWLYPGNSELTIQINFNTLGFTYYQIQAAINADPTVCFIQL